MAIFVFYIISVGSEVCACVCLIIVSVVPQSLFCFLVRQVDIAPTLALLYGVPIPKNNVGIVMVEVFKLLTGLTMSNFSSISVGKLLDQMFAFKV